MIPLFSDQKAKASSSVNAPINSSQGGWHPGLFIYSFSCITFKTDSDADEYFHILSGKVCVIWSPIILSLFGYRDQQPKP